MIVVLADVFGIAAVGDGGLERARQVFAGRVEGEPWRAVWAIAEELLDAHPAVDALGLGGAEGPAGAAGGFLQGLADLPAALPHIGRGPGVDLAAFREGVNAERAIAGLDVGPDDFGRSELAELGFARDVEMAVGEHRPPETHTEVVIAPVERAKPLQAIGVREGAGLDMPPGVEVVEEDAGQGIPVAMPELVVAPRLGQDAELFFVSRVKVWVVVERRRDVDPLLWAVEQLRPQLVNLVEIAVHEERAQGARRRTAGVRREPRARAAQCEHRGVAGAGARDELEQWGRLVLGGFLRDDEVVFRREIFLDRQRVFHVAAFDEGAIREGREREGVQAERRPKERGRFRVHQPENMRTEQFVARLAQEQDAGFRDPMTERVGEPAGGVGFPRTRRAGEERVFPG